MNLKKRILRTSIATMLMMLGLMTVAGVLIYNLQFHIHLVNDEYRELQLLEQLDGHIVTSQGELRLKEPNYALILKELRLALSELEYFVNMQDDQQGQTIEHLHLENRQARLLIQKLGPLLAEVETSSPLSPDEKAARYAQLGEIHDTIQKLVIAADDLVDDALVRSRRAISLAVILMVILFFIGAGLSLVLAYLQYNWCITPIQKLVDQMRKTVAIKPQPDEDQNDLLGHLNTGFIGLVNELDELYRTQDERIRVKSRELVQSERLASVGYLAAGVAHEVNNPLNSILGCSELLLRDASKKEAAVSEGNQQLLQIIRDEAFRCRQIVEKLLSLVRPSDVPRETVNLAEITHQVVSLLDRLKQFRHCQFELELPADLPLHVRGRASELKQVLLNLVINAAEATQGVEGRVHITGKATDEAIELEISDNGKGMAADTLDHIFSPFFTLKRGGEQVGVGLGLSIVHAIIEDHQGTIRAYSEGIGRGSRFVIRLPPQPVA